MIKQFDETIRDYLLGSLKNRRLTSSGEVLKLLYDSQRVRNTDYIIYFDSNGTTSKQSKEIITRANWYFILTNAACWFDVGVNNFPKLGVKFENVTPNSPFRAEDTPGGPVLSKLDWGRESDSLPHFEEYKNLYWALGQRIAIDVNFEPVTSGPIRGAVLLSGIEINLFNEA